MAFAWKSVSAAALLAATFAMTPVTPSQAETMQMTKPLAGSTMFFADRYATAYYSLDKANFRTVVTIAPGPNGKGNPVQLVNSLADGESAKYSVGGYGKNSIKVTLKLTRQGETVTADVSTENTPPNS
jgi:hypothetical protein